MQSLTPSQPRASAESALPRSVVRWFDPLLILVVLIVFYSLLSRLVTSPLNLVLLLVGITILVMAPLELKGSGWIGTPYPKTEWNQFWRAVGIKWVGTMAGLELVFLVWRLLPEYSKKNYHPLFEAMPICLPIVLTLIPVCIIYTEWRLGPRRDHAWHLGMLVFGQWKLVDFAEIRTGLFGWIVKGFFLPLNFCGSLDCLGAFRGREAQIFHLPWPAVVHMADKMIFFVLLIAIIPGYLFSTRLLGTEIRKVDQSALGWAVTLACYPPYNEGIWRGLLTFHGILPNGAPLPWVSWTQGAPGVFYLVGALILIFEFVHYWAEATCGLRSSHLSHRGIITSGIFRYTKHPVYVVKFFGWGFMWLPFLSGQTWSGCLRQTAVFILFAFVYVMRAWVEERLLSSDPDYVRYGLWMDENSVFRFVGRAVPFFRYQYRLERFFKMVPTI